VEINRLCFRNDLTIRDFLLTIEDNRVACYSYKVNIPSTRTCISVVGQRRDARLATGPAIATTTTNPRGLAALDASTFTSGLAFLPSVFAFGGVNGNEGGICRQTLANDPARAQNRVNRDSAAARGADEERSIRIRIAATDRGEPSGGESRERVSWILAPLPTQTSR